MASPWITLGLDGPTDDLRQVKRAYAKKLKTTRPEEDPDAFMALREAMELAQAFIQHQRHLETDSAPGHLQTSEPKDAPQPLTLLEHSDTQTAHVPTSHAPETRGADIVMTSVTRLMADPRERTSKARWSEILNDKRLEPIDEAHDFEDVFLYYLLGEFGYIDGDSTKHNRNRAAKLITPEIATYIFAEMGWNNSLSRPLYKQDQLEWLRVDLGVHLPGKRQLPPTYHLATQVEPTNGTLKWSLLLIFCLYLIYMAYTYI